MAIRSCVLQENLQLPPKAKYSQKSKKTNFECPSGTPNCSTKSVEIITMMTKTRDSENKNMAVDGKRCQFSVLKS